MGKAAPFMFLLARLIVPTYSHVIDEPMHKEAV